MRALVVGLAALSLSLSLTTSALAQEAKTPPAAAAPPQTTPAKPATRTTSKPATRSDVAVGAALARLDVGPRLEVPVDPTLVGPAPSASAALAPSTSEPPRAIPRGGLADIHVASSVASDKAGSARDVQVDAAPATAAPKPIATVRVQSKMGVAHALDQIAPAIEACRAQANGANGTIPIRLDVAATGEVEHADPIVPPPSADATPALLMPKVVGLCLARALATAKFGAPRGRGVILTVPISVGQDRGDVTRSASRE